MKHKEFVSKYKSNGLRVHVSRIDAGIVVSSGIMPRGYFYNYLFWNWLFILSFPISIAVFIWSEIWLGILVLVFACLIPKAQRETNCKSIIWHSLDNEEFFYLVLEKEVIKIEEF